MIKHKSAMDVCGWVVEKQPDYLNVLWINMAFVKSFIIGETARIPRKHLKDWEICLQPDLRCLRYAEWGPIDYQIFDD